MQKRFTNRTKIWKGMSAKELLEQYAKAGFNAKRLGEASYVWKKMLQDKTCLKVLTAAGALIAGGMRNIFTAAANAKLFDAMIATGGSILTHDLIEAFGIKHEQGNAFCDDKKLAKKSIDRIYDVFLPNKGYLVLEEKLLEIFPKMPQEKMAPSKFLSLLGPFINDKKSIIRTCSERGIKIFCPGITDSILGFQLWMYGQDHALKIDVQEEISEFLNFVWEKKKYGAIILGGGMPKHFVAGMMQVTGKSLNYAIQITEDRPEHGGVSGASLEEAKSWKKVAADALTADVRCDVTIAFPLLVSSLL